MSRSRLYGNGPTKSPTEVHDLKDGTECIYAIRNFIGRCVLRSRSAGVWQVKITEIFYIAGSIRREVGCVYAASEVDLVGPFSSQQKKEQVCANVQLNNPDRLSYVMRFLNPPRF